MLRANDETSESETITTDYWVVGPRTTMLDRAEIIVNDDDDFMIGDSIWLNKADENLCLSWSIYDSELRRILSNGDRKNHLQQLTVTNNNRQSLTAIDSH